MPPEHPVLSQQVQPAPHHIGEGGAEWGFTAALYDRKGRGDKVNVGFLIVRRCVRERGRASQLHHKGGRGAGEGGRGRGGLCHGWCRTACQANMQEKQTVSNGVWYACCCYWA